MANLGLMSWDLSGTYMSEKESDAIADILERMAQESRDADKFARYYVRTYKPNNWLKMHGFTKRRRTNNDQRTSD